MAYAENLTEPRGPWRVELVIECKKGTPGRPWVVFVSDAKLPSDRVVIEAFSRVDGTREDPPMAVLGSWVGVPLFTADIFDQLGHARVSMTQDVYLGRKPTNAANMAVLSAHNPDAPGKPVEDAGDSA